MRLVQVGRETCARSLRPGHVKRHPLRGALFGYYMACPACGFRALHEAAAVKFLEDGEQLHGIEGDVDCVGCAARLALSAAHWTRQDVAESRPREPAFTSGVEAENGPRRSRQDALSDTRTRTGVT